MELTLLLLLGITCAAEINIQASPEECLIMIAINQRNADRRGIDLYDHTLEFNSVWKKGGSRSRPWLLGLRENGNMPKGWTSTPEVWETRFKPRWLGYLTAIARFLATPPAPRYCPKADDYGGTPDDGIGADDKKPCFLAKRVECMPGELQAYWDLNPCWLAKR